MSKTFFVKCDLYGLNNNTDITNCDIKYPVVHSDVNFLRTIIVSPDILGKACELFTGVEFDCSVNYITERYSKFFDNFYLKKRIVNSRKPIHIYMNSNKFYLENKVDANFEYADSDDISAYYSNIISEFNTLDNYEKYLLSLKEIAYNKYDDIITERNRSKRIKLTRIV